MVSREEEAHSKSLVQGWNYYPVVMFNPNIWAPIREALTIEGEGGMKTFKVKVAWKHSTVWERCGWFKCFQKGCEILAWSYVLSGNLRSLNYIIVKLEGSSVDPQSKLGDHYEDINNWAQSYPRKLFTKYLELCLAHITCLINMYFYIFKKWWNLTWLC